MAMTSNAARGAKWGALGVALATVLGVGGGGDAEAARQPVVVNTSARRYADGFIVQAVRSARRRTLPW